MSTAAQNQQGPAAVAPTRRQYTIDVIAGDGIGKEVIPAAVRCIDAASKTEGFSIIWRERPWGSDHYRATGWMMPENGLKQLSTADAIFLGAVGDVDIPDDVTLWGLLIPIRRAFHQYANLRPARTLPGVRSPAHGRDIDVLIVRENVEGEYSELGGRFSRGNPDEFAMQTTVFTRLGVERITRFAGSLATQRRGVLVSATKSNGIIHTMPFWDEVVQSIIDTEYPEVAVDKVLIDALAARLVLKPETVDVIVASNLFGDILSDLAAAVAGSIGVAPSANLNPERDYPSLFEPVHGSAPDIAGRGIANPVAAIWAGAMMLNHLGEPRAATRIITSFESALSSGIATPDLGGTASTEQFTSQVVANLAQSSTVPANNNANRRKL
jgi:tartrate dehydrogenase/decarboxylase/D-malate dehydrogenase